MSTTSRFTKMLAEGPMLCAEGYVFALERAGYCAAGPFVPTAVLEHPEVVRQIHRDFVHAGSDVVLALTYYGHREKMRIIGREDQLEELNLQALKIAKEVAAEAEAKYNRPILVAGNISNTTLWGDGDEESYRKQITTIYEEQIKWASKAGVDFILGETFGYLGEALCALDCIKRIAPGMPSVINFTIMKSGKLLDGATASEAVRALEKAGADVAGINCHRGPATMIPLIREIFMANPAPKIPIAALPVPYRTTEEEPAFATITDKNHPNKDCCRPFPVALDPFTCTRYEIEDFTKEARDLGVRFFGVCCGASPHHIRSMAEALGKIPPASKYAPDMAKHFALGSDPSLKKNNKACF
eukprot:TRINITY_DN447_c0_g1_i1.p1 TRINITY_DN447_c0_g1~~TRINITY_DN447_c0_g1_i1.p1  ORF type:complete len:370 (+),score=67.07 TRINITY_DN447_c0_g1_i1:40-1110(+)